jgi:hypothetical protein
VYGYSLRCLPWCNSAIVNRKIDHAVFSKSFPASYNFRKGVSPQFWQRPRPVAKAGVMPLRDELAGACIYPANDNTGPPRNSILRISARIHPAALRIQAELCFILWRAARTGKAGVHEPPQWDSGYKGLRRRQRVRDYSLEPLLFATG